MIERRVIIITGPTASGKTQLSEILQPIFNGEIINADVGQFYKPLSIGTAKPNLDTIRYNHHLFDLIDIPQDISIFKYRQLVSEKEIHIFSKNKTPIIVGGSLFYIKSLFFPAAALKVSKNFALDIDLDNLSETESLELLKKIDPYRASQIHQNDIYRIRRALDIWKITGQKPSSYKPTFSPLFNAVIVFVSPPTEVLNARIKQRTEQMINSGWIEEAKTLMGTDWEAFVNIKGLIGYSEIFEWLKSSPNSDSLPNLISKIQIRTIQYAKRQRTFWRGLANQLYQESNKTNFVIKILEVSSPDEALNQLNIQISSNLAKAN